MDIFHESDMRTNLTFTSDNPADDEKLELVLRSQEILFTCQEMFEELEGMLRLGKDLPEEARAFLQALQVRYVAITRELEVHHLIFRRG